MEVALSSAVHRVAIGVHAVLAVWLLVNGAAHQLGVMLGAWRGTLKHPEDLDGLLACGAGLLVAGALVSWSLAGQRRADALTRAFSAAAVQW